jgi:hypothetical protein
LNIDSEGNTESQLDESPVKKSLESLFKEVITPTNSGHQNEIARFYYHTLLYISPSTNKLHSDIFQNCPANFSHHNNNMICVSRKSLLTNIDYMIDYGQLVNNLQAAKIFGEMKKFVQEQKIKIQKLIMPEKSLHQKKDPLNLRHSLERRSNLSQD